MHILHKFCGTFSDARTANPLTLSSSLSVSFGYTPSMTTSVRDTDKWLATIFVCTHRNQMVPAGFSHISLSIVCMRIFPCFLRLHIAFNIEIMNMMHFCASFAIFVFCLVCAFWFWLKNLRKLQSVGCWSPSPHTYTEVI